MIMIQAICWTLVHSLWQGLLFAMAAGVVLLLTRRARAAVRYSILCGLFFLFLAVCAGTLVYELSGGAVGESRVGRGVFAGGWMAGWIGALGRYCSDHALLIVWVWLFVFSIRSLRMLGSLLYTQRIRHYGISPAPADWQKKVDELSRQLGIRRAVKLVESRIVKMPLVTGHWRPMIFIPLGLLTGLPAGEIEAVLLHELAHIRRNDWLVNFLQHIADNLLFFNPGFLWISALLREERENCCDDIAIERTHDRIQFVRALINFKEHDLRMTKLANTFPAGRDQLLKRVTRIAHNTNKTLDPAEKVFLVVSCVLVVLLMIATSAAPISTHRQEEFIRQEKEDIRSKMALEQAVKNKKQAEEDMEKTARDRAQADRDRLQAGKDEQQAILDKLQAENSERQALLDKFRADRDAAVRARPPIVNLKK